MQFTFFWSGPFSQWAPSNFTADLSPWASDSFKEELELWGIPLKTQFNTAEQFMMCGKAVIFEDKDFYEIILNSDDPEEQKAAGRQIRNFDKTVWELHAKDIVYAGSYAKYTQSDYYKSELLKTGDTLIVEASPEDKIWGIGLRKEDPRCKNPDLWQGTNWLGEVLTKVREDIK